MKVAVPVWQNTVSNVLDFAQKILVVDFEKNIEKSRKKSDLEKANGQKRAARLKQLQVNVLICGALYRSLAEMIERSGVKLFLAQSKPRNRQLTP